MRASATSRLAVAAAACLLLLSSPLAAQGFGQPRELFPQDESRSAPPSAPHDVQVPQLPQDETRRDAPGLEAPGGFEGEDRKSTRLNSSHVAISYAVFCLKKKKATRLNTPQTT